MIIYREIDIDGNSMDQNQFCDNCNIPNNFNDEKKYECYNSINWPCLEDSFTSDCCLYCDSCNKRLLKCFYLMDLSKTLDCAVDDKEHLTHDKFMNNHIQFISYS